MSGKRRRSMKTSWREIVSSAWPRIGHLIHIEIDIVWLLFDPRSARLSAIGKPIWVTESPFTRSELFPIGWATERCVSTLRTRVRRVHAQTDTRAHAHEEKSQANDRNWEMVHRNQAMPEEFVFATWFKALYHLRSFSSISLTLYSAKPKVTHFQAHFSQLFVC